MRKLYVVRHGETDFNIQNRYAGSTDVELNENGINQAKSLAQSIENFPIDIIISSSKKRAFKTAQIIKRHINKTLILSDDFIERNIGVYEGLTREEAKSRYPKLWSRNVLHELDNTQHEGESVNQVKQRVQNGLNDISNDYKDQNILLVTHGYVSRIIHGLLNDISDEELRKFLLGNCEVIKYDID